MSSTRTAEICALTAVLQCHNQSDVSGPGDQCRQAYTDCEPGIWDEVIIKTSDFTERDNK